MAPDGEYIVFGRTLQTAEFEEHAQGIGVADLELLGLLAQADGLHACFLNLVEVGLTGQLEPHDVAWVGILAAVTVLALFVHLIHAIFIQAHHAHVVVVVQKLLGLFPEAVFNDMIHASASIAINEDGEFGRLRRHVDHLVVFAPGIKLSLHFVGDGCEVHLWLLVETQTQLAIHQLPFAVLQLTVFGCHLQVATGIGGIGEPNFLKTRTVAACIVLQIIQ